MLRHKIHEITFPSGIKGIIIDTPKTGVVVAEVSFRAGEFLLDKEKWETAHLMEHVLLGANKYYKRARDFQAAIEQNGAYSNASTSTYDITYETEAAHFEWKRVVGLMLDGISTPKFLQEEFDSEVSNVREELISRGNNHFRHLNLALRQVMGMASLTDQERLELIHHVTRADLVRHYGATHTLANARFVIAGHFKGDYSEIEKLFGERLILKDGNERVLLPKEDVEKLEGPLVLRKPSVPNIYLYIDFYVPREYTAREKIVLKILCTILTETMYSRVFGTAREKGWVYGMGSGGSYARDLSGWWIGAQVSKTNSKSLVRLVRDELLRLKRGELDDDDFEAARKHLLGKIMRSGQTASGVAGSYGQFYANDEYHDVNKLPKTVRAIKKKECIQLIRELIDSNLWGLGALGSVSQKPARELHAFIAEVFEKE